MNERATRIARRFDIPIGIAALAVIPILIVEETSAGQPYDTLAVIADWLSWGVFAAELVTMLVVVDDRRRWLNEHPFDVLVVLLTPPLLPAALASIRLIRLLRLGGARRVAPYLFTLKGLRLAAAIVLFTMVASGLVFASIEGIDADDGIWWSFTTMTTVGSDIYPTSAGSRVIAALAVLVGVSFVAMLTGALAQFFLRPEVAELEQEIEEEIAEAEVFERELLDELASISTQIAEMERRLRRQMGSTSAR